MTWWGSARWPRAALVLVIVAVALGVARAEEAPARAGVRAHVDPRSGRLVPTRPPGAPPEQPPAGLDRSSAGLVEVPAPGGGVMVDLKGRFRSPLAATITPDGSVRLEHVPPAAAR